MTKSNNFNHRAIMGGFAHNPAMDAPREEIAEYYRAVRATGLSALKWASRAGRSGSIITRFQKEPLEAYPPKGTTLAELIEVAPKSVPVPLPVLRYAGLAPEEGEGTFSIKGAEYVAVPRYDAAISGGPGSIVSDPPEPAGHSLFEIGELRTIASTTQRDRLAVVKIRGNSMAPVLLDGDSVLVDLSEQRVRWDGTIYVVRTGEDLQAKRLSHDDQARTITMHSNDPAIKDRVYPEDEVHILGRVIRVVDRGVQ